MSNGIDFGSIMSARRGSFITFLLMRSRSARDLYTIHENTTVSPALALAAFVNGTPIFTFRSSPAHSTYWSAPYSFQIFPAFCDTLRYTASFLVGTDNRNPSA